VIGETYPFISEEYTQGSDVLFFVFLSQGERVVPKAIGFTPIEKHNSKFYNWGFGDLVTNEETGEFEIDDETESNNGDVKTVFYTVVSTLSKFFEFHPEATVHIEGSNRQRTRIYKGFINRYWGQIEPYYDVRGYASGKIRDFEPGTEYEYLLISRKKT